MSSKSMFSVTCIRGIKKNKNFTKYSKSSKGRNSCKNEFRVIFPVCKYFPCYSDHIF